MGISGLIFIMVGLHDPKIGIYMNSLPNVLFINHSVRDGGPGRSLYYLLRFLDRTKLRPYVLIPKDDVFSEWLRGASIYENVIVEPRFPENLKKPRFGTPDDRGRSGRPSSYLDKLLNFLSVSLNVLDIGSLVVTSKVIHHDSSAFDEVPRVSPTRT